MVALAETLRIEGVLPSLVLLCVADNPAGGDALERLEQACEFAVEGDSSGRRIALYTKQSPARGAPENEEDQGVGQGWGLYYRLFSWKLRSFAGSFTGGAAAAGLPTSPARAAPKSWGARAAERGAAAL